MKGGFSFCGVDIADIGLEYAPENKDTYVYAPAVSEVHEETFEGHHGGYIYGAYKQPKEFVLRCYYEDTNISKGIMAKAYALFKVGKSGPLVFKRRSWCYYQATVTSVDASEMYSRYNGLFVITLKAYYPFAKGNRVNGHLFSNALTDPDHDEAMTNTGLLEDEAAVPEIEFNTIPEDMPVLLYNPGTERAKVGIQIAGNAGENGIRIWNVTTNQDCKYIAFNTTGNQYIYTDGISGKTVINDNGNQTLAFQYHDYGFIELEPAFPIIRDIYASCSGNVVTTLNTLCEDPTDAKAMLLYPTKYIYLNNSWHKIMSCTGPNTLIIQDSVNATLAKTNIVTMNELYIMPTNNTNITKLKFVYSPTYA